MNTPNKRCISCGVEYPATTEFFFMGKGKLVNQCKKCRSAKIQEWRNAHPDKIKVYDTHNELFKEFIEWRLTWYVKRYESLLAQTEKDLRYYKAIKECFDKKFPSKLNSFKNKSEVTITLTLLAVDVLV